MSTFDPFPTKETTLMVVKLPVVHDVSLESATPGGPCPAKDGGTTRIIYCETEMIFVVECDHYPAFHCRLATTEEIQAYQNKK
jgi:hypothetical protein